MLSEKVRVGEAYWTREGGVAWVTSARNVEHARALEGIAIVYRDASLRDLDVIIDSWREADGIWGYIYKNPEMDPWDLVARVCGSPSFPHLSTCPRWYDERKGALARECNNGEAVLYAE